MWNYSYTDELYHYGVKGQKWGVRNYQYADGSLTPAGKRRYGNMEPERQTALTKASKAYSKAVDTLRGRQVKDSYLDKNTEFARIQTSKDFEKFAFYATYKKDDMDKYLGLFGKNLRDRAAYDAKSAEKLAKKTNSLEDLENAKKLRDKSDGLQVYQLKLNTNKRMRIPSDENASDILSGLMRDPEFKENVMASLTDSKEKMKRPTQQALFNSAINAMQKDSVSYRDRVDIYRAFNLSLTNHNPQEIAAQDAFYGALKKKGYSALLDYNDKEFSSYHAKRPMIVFDVDAVVLQSVSSTNPQVVNQLYKKYNRERIVKEFGANTIGFVAGKLDRSFSECADYVETKKRKYLQ